MSREEAVARVVRLVAGAAEALPPGAALELQRREDDFPCDDPTDGGPPGRIIVEHRHWVRGADTDTVAAALRTHWDSAGYYQLRSVTAPRLKLVYEDPDGYRLSLKTNPRGDLLLTAWSPCVWPDGSPPSPGTTPPGATPPGAGAATGT